MSKDWKISHLKVIMKYVCHVVSHRVTMLTIIFGNC